MVGSIGDLKTAFKKIKSDVVEGESRSDPFLDLHVSAYQPLECKRHEQIAPF